MTVVVLVLVLVVAAAAAVGVAVGVNTTWCSCNIANTTFFVRPVPMMNVINGFTLSSSRLQKMR